MAKLNHSGFSGSEPRTGDHLRGRRGQQPGLQVRRAGTEPIAHIRVPVIQPTTGGCCHGRAVGVSASSDSKCRYRTQREVLIIHPRMLICARIRAELRPLRSRIGLNRGLVLNEAHCTPTISKVRSRLQLSPASGRSCKREVSCINPDRGHRSFSRGVWTSR
jgi:hypothetical protein